MPLAYHFSILPHLHGERIILIEILQLSSPTVGVQSESICTHCGYIQMTPAERTKLLSLTYLVQITLAT